MSDKTAGTYVFEVTFDLCGNAPTQQQLNDLYDKFLSALEGASIMEGGADLLVTDVEDVT